MKFSLIFLLFSFFCFYVSCDVFIIDEDNVDRMLSKHPIMIVYFSDKDATAEEEEFLERISTYESAGFVNCKKNEDVCLDFKLKKSLLPKLSLVAYGHAKLYEEDSTNFDEMELYVKEYLLGNVVLIKTLEDVEQLEQGQWLVKYFAPWCGHCKKLAPIWTEFSRRLDDENITVAKVDCSGELSDYCTEKGVSGFPKIVALKNGEHVATFDADRNYKNLLSFAKKFYTNDEL